MSKTYPIPRHILQDLAVVENELNKAVSTADGVLAEASTATLKAGGKRLRPALVLMSGMVGAYDLKAFLPAAVASELIHMASLIHDDILDDAATRRGFPTVYSLWGERTAVAAGDFLFATAFKILARSDMRSVEIMVKAALDLTLGEFDQMVTAHVIEQSFDDYLRKAKRKTAALFTACCQAGAYLSGAPAAEIDALSRYGENLGVAFQIYDDVLDVAGGAETGKALGVDVRDGTVTVPVLYALEHFGRDSRFAELVATQNPSDEEVREAIALIGQSDAISRTKETARTYVDEAIRALGELSNDEAVAVFTGIGEFVVDRYH
ncbi:MAG: polyprenyl synthetase family protein [Candidatus Aquicultor sp.]|nr:polyprenyl synthetase family protein [Candidatus Aquicultor sp.]